MIASGWCGRYRLLSRMCYELDTQRAPIDACTRGRAAGTPRRRTSFPEEWTDSFATNGYACSASTPGLAETGCRRRAQSQSATSEATRSRGIRRYGVSTATEN
jgi:hypothetical protein